MSQKQAKNIYQSPECGLHYEGRETAKQCEAWRKEHKSCNLEITKFADENEKAEPESSA